MTSKALVHIIAVNKQDYAANAQRAGGSLYLAQCVVTTRKEGEPEKIMVGELMLPRHLQETQPGQYLAEFELSIGRDKRVGSMLASLVPFQARPVAKAQ